MQEGYGAARTCCLPLDAILPPTNRPEEIDAQELRKLAASIRREGLLAPLTVEEIGNGQFRLLDGAKRYAACWMIGMTHVDAVIQPGKRVHQSAGELMEALMDGRLHYLEQAMAFHRLEAEFGIRSEMLSGMLGVAPETIGQKISLLSLEAPLQSYILQNDLPETHAYQLLRLPQGEMRMQLARQAVEGRLGVRDVELLTRSMLMRLPGQSGRTIALVRDYRLYANAIRSMADQMRENGVDAAYDEQRDGATLVVTVRIPIRRSRSGREHAAM